ncbi:unnamed protein product [Laminaria digitata]
MMKGQESSLNKNEGGKVSTRDINSHAIIAGFMVLDQMLVATKFERGQMMLASFLYTVTYSTCNIAWFLLGPKSEKVIYTAIDWDNGIEKAITLVVGTVFVMVPVGSLIHYGVYRLREHIFASWGKGEPRRHTDVDSGKLVVLEAEPSTCIVHAAEGIYEL